MILSLYQNFYNSKRMYKTQLIIPCPTKAKAFSRIRPNTKFLAEEGCILPVNYTRKCEVIIPVFNLPQKLLPQYRIAVVSYRGNVRTFPTWITFGLTSLFALATLTHLYPSPYARNDMLHRVSPLTTV